MLHSIVFGPGPTKGTETIYAAIAAEAGSGLFRSDDSGRHWQAVSSLDGSEGLLTGHLSEGREADGSRTA